MKKRWIVSAAALSAAALAVTGCGASASDSSVSGNSDDSAASGDAGELYVYNWGEYIDETVIDEFEEETGIKVVYDLYETNEEMYPVIEAGGIAYDAVCPSDFMSYSVPLFSGFPGIWIIKVPLNLSFLVFP